VLHCGAALRKAVVVNSRFPTLLTAALLLLSGCANLRTDKSHYAGVDEMLAQADYPAAVAKIEAAENTAYTAKDRVVYYLDIGMLLHWNGDYERSNEFLERAERAIEENFTKSVTRSAASLILNDNTLEYAGEDYEDIYLNVFKAMNYLALGRNDEAFVEVRRINNKLVLLESKYDRMAQKLSEAEEAGKDFRPGKSRFQESALGRYLGVLLYRNDYKWDDVRIDFEKIDRGWKLQPDIYTFSKPDFTTEKKRRVAPKARLNIIAFSGLAPDKTASTFYVHTEENLIVLAGTSEDYLGKQRMDGLNVIPWPDVKEGYHFKFQLPSMQKRPSQVREVTMTVAGGETLKLQRIESLENAALEAFSIRKPMIYLKTLTRAVTKGLAAEQAKAKMTKDMDDGFSFLTRIMTDLVTDQTENADLRVSRFFPAEAHIREVHLDEGTYDVRIDYYGYDGNLLYTDHRTGVQLEAGRLNVLESAHLN
jgi:hypothetical protein